MHHEDPLPTPTSTLTPTPTPDPPLVSDPTPTPVPAPTQMPAPTPPSPMAAPAGYQGGPWAFTAPEFHRGGRVGSDGRELVLPGCVDSGKPFVRYVLAQPATDAAVLLHFAG